MSGHQVEVVTGGAGYRSDLPCFALIGRPASGGTPAVLRLNLDKTNPATGALLKDAIEVLDGGSNYSVINPPEVVIAQRHRAESNPEQHLDHYLIRRKWLDGSGGDKEFRVKPAAVLHLTKAGGLTRLKRLRPRFSIHRSL